MIELIDQRDPLNRVYRCSRCGVSANSIPSRAKDGYLWTPTPNGVTPGVYAFHRCAESDIRAFEARTAAEAKAAAEEVARVAAAKNGKETELVEGYRKPRKPRKPKVETVTDAKPKRGRPRKTEPLTAQ